MKLFSKSVDTKRDHFAELKTALSAAIAAAENAGVPPRAIQDELEDHASYFRRAEAARMERRQYGTPIQHVATATGFKTVDPYEQMARSEERRAARQLKDDRAEYQAGLARRAEQERWTR
jgi:hypothetical protein